MKCYTACRVKGKPVGAGRRFLASTDQIQEDGNVQSQEVRPGTAVRVKEGYRRPELEGMGGTIEHCWGSPDYLALDVRLEDGRLELFWLPNLDAVEEDIAV